MPRHVLDVREEARTLGLSAHNRGYGVILAAIAVLMLIMILLAK